MARSSTLVVLGTDLVTNLSGTVGALGVDLFVGYMPDAPDSVLSIWEEPGPPVDRVLSGGSIGTDRSMVSLFSRGAATGQGAQNAEGRIWAVAEYLDAISARLISGVTFYSVARQGVPMLVERDANGRPVYRCNFLVERTP